MTTEKAIESASLNVIPSIDVDRVSSIQDLIPTEIREALKARDGEQPLPEPTHKEITSASLDKEVKEKEEPVTDDADIDTSEEAINKLLEGDPNAITKKKVEGEEPPPPPPWHADDGYKALLKRAVSAGVKQADLDTIIEAASDKKILDKAAFIQGLQEKTESLESEQENLKTDNVRLRRLERATQFDELDETKENFITPMTAAYREVKKILDMEGAGFTVLKLMSAKDRTEFNEVTAGTPFSDTDLVKLANHWRSYRELENGYTVAKNAASEDIQKALKTSLPAEQSDKIINSSLIQFAGADPKYNYIKEAISAGVSTVPEVAGLINSARANFKAFEKALADPSAAVHDQRWMSDLMKFCLYAEHNKNVAGKYTELQKSFTETEQRLKAVAKAYQKLLGSAKGIGSEKGSPLKLRTSSNGKGKDDPERILAEFTKILETGEIDM